MNRHRLTRRPDIIVYEGNHVSMAYVRDAVYVAGEGNRIARAFWRKGHNREARRLVFNYVFNILKADLIETECWSDNINSVLSIKAHGFTFASEELDFNKKHDKQMLKSHFVFTREDWQQLPDATC